MSYGIVTTIGQRCKRCYSCIRECPARAIKVVAGQAVVMEERCISCGHCVKVCSQNAKKIKSDIDKVLLEVIPSGKGIAILAPSFPASFPESFSKVVSGLKQVGFKSVTEAAFGADLIAALYEDYLDSRDEKVIISSPCPAVYNLVEKYYEQIVPNLAKVVSPMIAMGRYIKKFVDPEAKVVFIGPCVAKKSEYMDEEVSDSIDAVLTFKELKEIFAGMSIDLQEMSSLPMDPPSAYLGKSFPLTGGLIKTANIPGDILQKEILVVEGKNRVVEIMDEISTGNLNSKFVDILFCEGCISGPAIDSNLNFYSRREKVIGYINENLNALDKNVWRSDLFNSRKLELKRKFHSKSQKRAMPSEEEIKLILSRTNKFDQNDELNCGSCGYPTCREYAVAIAKDLAEDEMCLPYLIDKLESAYHELKETQDQLHSAEKLASIGQLAAGVAHEINNPLGSIMLYASILKKNAERNNQCEQTCEDLNLIMEEANRCRNIVANLLNFARQGKLNAVSIDMLDLVNSTIRDIKLNQEFASISYSVNRLSGSMVLEADPDQLKQVLLNLLINSSEAVESSIEKKIEVDLKSQGNLLSVEITDSGCGIPEENLNKIFTPFFTTKKMGKGTGLGLAITYGIIKMHKGDVKVKSTVGKGTVFTIELPLAQQNKFGIMN